MTLRAFGLGLALVLVLAGCDSAEAPPAADYLTRIPDPKTQGEAYVSNPDHLLSAPTEQALNATLRHLDQAGRAHIDVVAVRSIGEETPKSAATELFNHWKIGSGATDNGLLLLLVEDQRRVEFETGYGLEADLPDILCFRIQQRYMRPWLQRQQYDSAVSQGVAAIIAQLQTGQLPASDSTTLAAAPEFYAPAEEFPESETTLVETSGTSWGTGTSIGVGVALVLFVVVGLILWVETKVAQAYHWLLMLGGLGILGLAGAAIFFDAPVRPGVLVALCYAWPWLYLHGYVALVEYKDRRYYSRQSRHIRFTFLHEALHVVGIMQLLFPLGLAFYWPRHQRRLAALRDAPYPCPTCGQPMHRLSEAEDDAFLEPGQVTEEEVGSVDYDVWQCAACAEAPLPLAYPNLDTEAQPCTKCHNRTSLARPDEVVQAATLSSEGWGWHVRRCAHCQDVTKTKYTIPQLSEAKSSSSSSSFSSDSSSSSSFSSSSGGSSGGGGAGSSW